jgi:hypothetical protein
MTIETNIFLMGGEWQWQVLVEGTSLARGNAHSRSGAMRLANEWIMRTCRVCGCTLDHACEGGCYWVEPDLSSKCGCSQELTEKTEPDN